MEFYHYILIPFFIGATVYQRIMLSNTHALIAHHGAGRVTLDKEWWGYMVGLVVIQSICIGLYLKEFVG